uniref:Uncharacterized protein n=1 Tax=Nelumbo nucifera TaxID=4432 RepID=A0A822YXF0_NELNU|nr:TPA_asm: hypothetical protein HUJ06_006066 [Nelumbo nucifera]
MACDIRYCTKDVFFSVKELALTGRRFSALEAKSMGLVSTVFRSKTEMDERIRAIAEGAGSLPWIGLDYVATWNSAMLLSDDLPEAVLTHIQKRKPILTWL